MTSLVLITEQALLIARPSTRWAVEQHMKRKSPDCVAVDPQIRRACTAAHRARGCG